MGKFKIEVHVKLIECDDSVSDKPTENDDGSFSIVISEQDAISIDKCERAVLQTSFPAMREAVSKHLSEVSKKRPEKYLKEKKR